MSDKNICDVSVLHVGVIYVCVCVCVSMSAGLRERSRTSKSRTRWLRFIPANEEAVSVLLGHSGNTHSEVTSKAG